MAGKKKGEGKKAEKVIIQGDSEQITCQRCGLIKNRYMKDFPFCYECYQMMLKTGEITP